MIEGDQNAGFSFAACNRLLGSIKTIIRPQQTTL